MTSAPDTWEAILGLPKPKTCNLQAACCAVSTPSLPPGELLAAAALGDETARNFFSLFIPHVSHEVAQAFYPEEPQHIARVCKIVKARATRNAMETDELVFYHCRYLDEQRRCRVYEDRPTLCREYPVSPMNILVKGCGYEDWAQACRKKLKTLGFEVVGESEA